MSFLMVGHAHNDIDASFGCWNMKLHVKYFPTISFFMKSYTNFNNVPVISRMIEEIPNFKAFIKPYMLKEVGCLVGHTKHNNSASI